MILEGTTDTGAVVPVQVTTDGKVVAQGQQGPEGPQGPQGPEGPAGAPGNLWSGTDPGPIYYAGGSVGIGTTTVSDALHVNTASGSTTVRVSSSTNSDGLQITARGDGTGTQITARGASSDLRVFTSDSGGSAVEAFRVDSSQRLLVGTSSSFSTAYAGATQNLQIQSTGANYASLSVIGNRNNATGAYLALVSSRSETAGGKTAVQSGDEISRITFEGADGTNYLRAADIACLVDGTPGTNDMPGRLVFSTSAAGANSPTTRMTIFSDGLVSIEKALVLKAPDGSRWAISVDNSGNLSTSQVV